MQGIRRKIGIWTLIIAFAAAGTGACDEAGEPVSASSLLPASTAAPRGCGDSGYLRTTLYGALDGEIDWATHDLDCEGMPRPDGAGARLRFAGSAGGDNRPVTIIIAVPALERGAAAKELASNVTLIEEGSGRFFSTTGLDNCWTDIDAQIGLKDFADTYSISGTLYCISPLAEVNGDSSVSVRELSFTGLLDWSTT